jgi:Rieske Fe-S protein
MDISSRLRAVPRRAVVRGAFWLLMAPAAALFGALVLRQDRVAWRPHQVDIPTGGDPIAFVEDVIVCRGEGQVRVFSARCTHLGCRISQAKDGLIVCPCHGSKFRPDGSVASGPATRPLEALAARTDPRTGALTVHVS